MKNAFVAGVILALAATSWAQAPRPKAAPKKPRLASARLYAGLERYLPKKSHWYDGGVVQVINKR